MSTPSFASPISLSLALSSPWQGRLRNWALLAPGAATAPSWDVVVTADDSLTRPTRPFFEARPTFHGPTCTLSLPGFLGAIDAEQQRAQLRAHPAATLSDIHYFLRAIMALALFRQDALLVHAAGVVTAAGALLFVGHSGAGKSTITTLAGQRPVLHDDLICLQPQGRGWLASTPPGENGVAISAYPLAGVLLLAHAPRNTLTPVQPALALAELVANSPVINAAAVHLPRLFDFWRSLLATTPLQRLHFRPDPSFWEVLDAYFE
jgi:hypothetical protein